MSPKIGRPQSDNSKSERIYIRVTPDEKYEIKQFCKENGYTVSDLIREGLKAIKK